MAKKQSWAEMDKSNIRLQKLIEGFELYNRTTTKSPRTVSWYTERLGLFQRFADEDATLSDISVANARAFSASSRAALATPKPLLQEQGQATVQLRHPTV